MQSAAHTVRASGPELAALGAVPALPEARGGRVRVLDLLRLLAAVQMVQGHTLDAVLALDARSGVSFAVWGWLRGLTSVAFLFMTGLAFHLVALRNHERPRWDAGVARRLRRAGLLVLLGYGLHAPLALLWGKPLADAWAEALIVDVLQCIGVSLGALELLALALRSAQAVRVCCALLAALLLALAPLFAGVDADGPQRAWLNYLTARGGSVFPLVPWASHVLLGVVLAPWLLAPRRRALRWLCAGGALVLLAWGAGSGGHSLAAMHVDRLGWVLVAGAALERFEPATRTWPTWVWRLSSETLFVYAFHVVLVYGQGVGLAERVGPSLAPALAVLVAAGMIALSFGAALGYRRALPTLAVRTAPG